MRIEMFRIKILALLTGVFLNGTLCALDREERKAIDRHARITKRLNKSGRKGFRSLISTLTKDYNEGEVLRLKLKKLNALFNAIQNMQDDLEDLQAETKAA